MYVRYKDIYLKPKEGTDWYFDKSLFVNDNRDSFGGNRSTRRKTTNYVPTHDKRTENSFDSKMILKEKWVVAQYIQVKNY
jgi:hypothetical protein